MASCKKTLFFPLAHRSSAPKVAPRWLGRAKRLPISAALLAVCCPVLLILLSGCNTPSEKSPQPTPPQPDESSVDAAMSRRSAEYASERSRMPKVVTYDGIPEAEAASAEESRLSRELEDNGYPLDDGWVPSRDQNSIRVPTNAMLR